MYNETGGVEVEKRNHGGLDVVREVEAARVSQREPDPIDDDMISPTSQIRVEATYSTVLNYRVSGDSPMCMEIGSLAICHLPLVPVRHFSSLIGTVYTVT